MENEEMSSVAELVLLLETLAENVELKAKTGQEAAEILREKAKTLKK